MSKPILNIIEPTLFDQTGHGYSYVLSLLLANNHFHIKVWLDERGQDLLPHHLCEAKLYFVRKYRQLQKIFLYYMLTKRQQTIFISTADLWDLRLLHFWSQFCKGAKIFLHFHQFKQTPKKLFVLQKLAPNSQITIMTPTEKLSIVFKNAGFRKCITLPCPSFYPKPDAHSNTKGFKKMLYAGAARSDKGFATVINLLRNLRANQNYIPFEIQISAPNSQRYDQDSAQALQILDSIPMQNIILHKQTLEKDQYLSMFSNSICLLLYDQNGYSDKFSGIALDAFYAGCPIITVSNTWMGDTATEYEAGIALQDTSLESIQTAMHQIIQNYDFYQENAKNAAQKLQQLHDPSNTLRCLAEQP